MFWRIEELAKRANGLMKTTKSQEGVCDHDIWVDEEEWRGEKEIVVVGGRERGMFESTRLFIPSV